MDFCGKYIKLVTLLVVVILAKGQKCSNLNTSGFTVPQGDIVLQYGSALNITCNLNKNVIDQYGQNASSRLYFQRNDSPIPSELVTIINSTSSTLYIENHPMTKDDNYYCYFNGTKESQEMICMNVVKVGGAPLNVTDFSCISRNCDNFTCTWTPPENYVKTDYYLNYRINIRQSRKNKTKGICRPVPENNDWSVFSCESIKTLSNGQKSCFWSVKTTPQYRPVHECYYFQLSMNNTFGSNVNKIEINHFKHVIPNPPENLTGVATSPHSIKLSWTIPTSMVTFQPGLHHRILYQCYYYGKVWHFGTMLSTNQSDQFVTYELQNLKYAHDLCDIRVSMRSAVADPSDDSMWSQNATRTIRTKSIIPDRPPEVTVGSFEVANHMDNRKVTVFWQHLLDAQNNGENLTYVVEARNTFIHKGSAKSPMELNLTYFEHVVDIWSKNRMGQSLEKSTLVIPAKPLDKITTFIAERRGSVYDLSWQAPPEIESVTNYTIFWCIDRANKCGPRLNWEVLPKHVTKHTKIIPESETYDFAISVNSQNNTSGMFWPECTASPDTNMYEIQNAFVINADSSRIKVGWSLRCRNRISTIQGYIIEYCQMASPQETSCMDGTLKNVTIKGDHNLRSAVVTGLRPCSTYSLKISYIVNNTVSPASKALRNATADGAPETPPYDVTATLITNSSISLSWKRPLSSCYVKDYNIYNYNNKIGHSETTDITLTNLSSYTKYEISIEACSTKCWERSAVKIFETLKSTPAVMDQPTISANDSHLMITWDKPDPPGGEISYYELRVRDSPDTNISQLINVTGQSYAMEGCTSGKHKHFHISVRAVNIIDKEHKAGNWSKDTNYPCTMFPSVVPILVCSSIVFLVGALVFGIKKGYFCLKHMKDVTIELPSGLKNVDNCSQDKVKDKEVSPSADAEQHLLQKNDEIRFSGDSSGCSSGHESITSSMGSTTHISPSDSGTEQPRSPSLSDEMTKNSLRQRVVSASRPQTNIGYVTTDTIPLSNLVSKPTTATPGNYCVIGVDPTENESDAAYLPIMDMNTKLPILCDLLEATPPPYVVTGDIMKTSNSGYVPYAATEPADKNTAYVVAGLPNHLLGHNLMDCDTPKPVLSEESPHYIRAGEAVPALKPVFHWPAPQVGLAKPGYVSVGDALPPKPLTEITKGYVPHRQYEGKSLKED